MAWSIDKVDWGLDKGDWSDTGPKPWPFTQQGPKWGYINNKRWSRLPASHIFLENLDYKFDLPDRHEPCGHWHGPDGPLGGPGNAPILTYDTFTQQGIDISPNYIAAAAKPILRQRGYTMQMCDRFGFNCVRVYDDEVLEGLDVSLTAIVRMMEVRGFPPMVISHVKGRGEGGKQQHFIKSDITGECSETVIFKDIYIDEDNWIETPLVRPQESRPKRSVTSSSTGAIIAAVPVTGKVAGVGTMYIHVNRSIDLGSSWEDPIKINRPYTPHTEISKVNLVCDVNDVFYLVASVHNFPPKPFNLWKSTDNGASWTEILTVPTSPIRYPKFLAIDISGTKIYVAVTYYIGHEARIWASEDGGATWTVGEPNISGDGFLMGIDIAANGNTVVMSCTSAYTRYAYIIRSGDGGLTWPMQWWTYPALSFPTFLEFDRGGLYAVVRNSGNNFTYSSCRSRIADTNNLAYLRSYDDGLTWKVESLDIYGAKSVYHPEYIPIYGANTGNEPLIWPMPDSANN